MADLAMELADLNANAKELIAKYNESFARLDAKSQELAQQLVANIAAYLEQLQTAKDESLEEIATHLQNGINELEAIIESGEFTRVITSPTIDIPASVAAGYEQRFTLDAHSLLNDAQVERFEVFMGQEEQEIAATNGTATITHTFSGNVGDRVLIAAVAIDSLGNRSAKSQKEVLLVANTPPAAPSVDAPQEVSKNQTFTVKIYGSSDPEGESVTYKVKDSGGFTFAKTQGIVENEEVAVTAPDVTEDTQMTFSVVAVDSSGLESDVVEVSLNVFASVAYGTVDIFRDGSCIFYAPFNNSTTELTGNYEAKLSGTLQTTEDGLLNDTANNTNAINFRYFNLPDKFSFSAFIQEISDVNTDIVTAIEFRGARPTIYGGNNTGVDGKRSISFGLSDGSDEVGVVEVTFGERYHVVYNAERFITQDENGNDVENMRITGFLNGEKVVEQEIQTPLFTDTQQRVLLFQEGDGTDSDGWDSGFDENQSFVGYIKNFRVFNRLVTEEEARILSQEA